MESGHSAAGDRHKEDREEVHVLNRKARHSRHIECRVLNEYTQHAADNHADQEISRQVVTGLLKKPHRHHGSRKEVDEDDIAPGIGVSIDRVSDAGPDHQHHQNKTDNELNTGIRLHILHEETEENGADHVDH